MLKPTAAQRGRAERYLCRDARPLEAAAQAGWTGVVTEHNLRVFEAFGRL